MRRAQQLHVQQPFDGNVVGVARRARDDGASARRRQITPAGLAGCRVLHLGHAADRIRDRAVTSTPAQVALERPGEILPLGLVQRRSGDDHAGSTETALKPLRLQKRILHRMQRTGFGKAFDGCDLARLGAIGWDQARMYCLAVEQHGAGAAVAGVAALLDAVTAELPQECAQALPGPWLHRIGTAVDAIAHDAASPDRSWRISSASTAVTCRRQRGEPCGSSTYIVCETSRAMRS